MFRNTRRILALVALAFVLPSPAPAQEFFFKDGDRVVMMGDSITEQLLYSNYVEMWTVTRFPTWEITFRNVGIGGDRSTGGNSRFARDVRRYNPTTLTVDFGTNDGGYKAFDMPTYRTYVTGLEGIESQARTAGLRVAWITPQPLDNADPGATALTGYNQTLEKLSAGMQEVAARDGGRFVDQFHPYLGVLDRARTAAPVYERITAGDAVHPGPPGQALMAASILEGLGFPAAVSAVSITVGATGDPKVVTNRCKVGDLTREGDNLRFERTDAALPFFPDEARPILKWAPLLEKLNQHTLQVVGLKPGRYAVRLGSQSVAEFDAEALGRGVNLADAALQTGPVADQVKAVKKAVEAKNRYFHDRIFRGVVLAPANVPDWLGVNLTAAEIDARRTAAFEQRMAKMPELDAAVRQALAVRPHLVEIVRLGD
jgi:lysophospholipase L1-like esterase